MRVVIRTDASLTIGTGHVVRCLALADGLRSRGADVLFVCREHPGDLIALIKSKSFSVVSMQSLAAEYVTAPDDVTHAVWLGVSWLMDADETIDAIRATHPEWLIVDHYAIDRRWELKLRPHVDKIMVIDDLADRPHDCDLLLDQNQTDETRYDSVVPISCTKLIGPKYAMLRSDFVVARKNLRLYNNQVKRVLIFFGGVDPTNETEKVLRVLARIVGRIFEIDVVVGSRNPYKHQIQNLCNEHYGVSFYCQVDNMAELMAEADLAFGSGGGAAWERCCLGLPTLVTELAENQRQVIKTLIDCGAAQQYCISTIGDDEKLVQLLSELTRQPGTLYRMSNAGLSVCDGYGIERISSVLLGER